MRTGRRMAFGGGGRGRLTAGSAAADEKLVFAGRNRTGHLLEGQGRTGYMTSPHPSSTICHGRRGGPQRKQPLEGEMTEQPDPRPSATPERPAAHSRGRGLAAGRDGPSRPSVAPPDLRLREQISFLFFKRKACPAAPYPPVLLHDTHASASDLVIPVHQT